MDKELMKKVDDRIDELKDDMIRDFQTLLRMRSVNEGLSEEGKPFGPDIYACLEEALRMGERLGLKTDNVDGYAGVLSAGEGEKSIGVLCHLDVVPEGAGWDFDPYGGEIFDGRIYGRGALDDKGPAIAAMYALKAIVDCKVPLKKKVEIILGCDEETGMRCLEYYKKHRPIPEMSFSPDGEFPVTNSEKSISTSLWRCEYDSGIKFKAGTVHNAVPGDAVALVPYIKPDKIEALSDKIRELSGCKLKAESEGEGSKITLIGRTAHASLPDEGINALQGMLLLLDMLPLKEKDAKAVSGLAKLLGMDYYGQNFGLDLEDESGRLTFNAGIMDWDEKGYSITYDLRIPISLKKEQVKEALSEHMGAIGAQCVNFGFSQGFCIPDDSPLVQTLLRVFNERSGLNLKPKHIGGGTYARRLPNAVSFGPEGYMSESNAHVANEHMSIEQLLFNCKVMADAMIALVAL